jgi:hypothetical protein
MGDTEAASLIKQNHASMSLETLLQVEHGFLSYGVGRSTCLYAVGGPLGQDQFHDRLTPSRAGNSRTVIIRVTAAPNE